MPAGSVSSFSTLQIFREASHLCELLCPTSLSAHSFTILLHRFRTQVTVGQNLMNSSGHNAGNSCCFCCSNQNRNKFISTCTRAYVHRLRIISHITVNQMSDLSDDEERYFARGVSDTARYDAMMLRVWCFFTSTADVRPTRPCQPGARCSVMCVVFFTSSADARPTRPHQHNAVVLRVCVFSPSHSRCPTYPTTPARCTMQ